MSELNQTELINKISSSIQHIIEIFRDESDTPVGELNLRLQNITHNFTRQGWKTQLEFRQDEASLVGGAI